MSADNGIYIARNREGNYDVRYYNASVDYDDDEDMTLLETTTTLEAAIMRGQSEQTEYGLHFGNLEDVWKN